MGKKFGQLLPSELQLFEDMQKVGEAAEKIRLEFESKKALFWATVENRLKVYDVSLKIVLKDFIVEDDDPDNSDELEDLPEPI